MNVYLQHRLTPILAAFLCVTIAATAQSGNTYRNPIIERMGLADPTVIRYEGKYYLYPTGDSKSYDVYVSADLVHWERKPKVFAGSHSGVWAPDVFHNHKGDGRFYLYYTVDAPRPPGGKQIGVAVATSPLGQFADNGVLVNGAIDAHLFQDDDNKLYLYYADLHNGFKIAVQPMANPLAKNGEPTVVIRPTDDWERRAGQVTEGPWMLKRNKVYYLMYSGSGANTPEYAIGYATARSPLGPFTKHTGNPIAYRAGNVIAPGHHCVVTGPDGKMWMIYHQKKTAQIGWDRFLTIDPLWFDDRGVIQVKLSRGTDEPAPTPVSAPRQ